MDIDDSRLEEVLGDIGTLKANEANDFAEARRKLDATFGLKGRAEDFDLAAFLTAVKEVVVNYGDWQAAKSATDTIHRIRRG